VPDIEAKSDSQNTQKSTGKPRKIVVIPQVIVICFKLKKLF